MAEKKEAKVRGECAAPGAIENARFIPIDIDYRSQTGEGVRWTSGPAPILVLGEWRHWNCATRRRGRRGAAVIASARGGLSAICFSRPSERTACTELHSGRRSLRACIAPRGILSRVWGANRQPTQGAYFKGKRGIVFQKREGGKEPPARCYFWGACFRCCTVRLALLLVTSSFPAAARLVPLSRKSCCSPSHAQSEANCSPREGSRCFHCLPRPRQGCLVCTASSGDLGWADHSRILSSMTFREICVICSRSCYGR